MPIFKIVTISNFLMPFIEPLLTLLIGILSTWFVSHLYYKKSSRELSRILRETDKLLSKFIEVRSPEDIDSLNVEAISLKRDVVDLIGSGDKSTQNEFEFFLPDLKSEMPAKILITYLPKTEFQQSEYFITLFLPNKKPILLHKIIGYGIQHIFMDFDADGIGELMITYHCGGHSMGMFIYKIPAKNRPYLIKDSEIGSDYPLIEVRDIDNDGQTEIISRQRDWENVAPRDYFEYVHKIIDNRLVEINENRFVLEDD